MGGIAMALLLVTLGIKFLPILPDSLSDGEMMSHRGDAAEELDEHEIEEAPAAEPA